MASVWEIANLSASFKTFGWSGKSSSIFIQDTFRSLGGRLYLAMDEFEGGWAFFKRDLQTSLIWLERGIVVFLKGG